MRFVFRAFVFSYGVFDFVRFPFACGMVFAKVFMASPVGRGHFVFG